MLIGQRTSTANGLVMPGGVADSIELYAKVYKTRDGSCPLPNGFCQANHTCTCVKNEQVPGAECHEFDDGCGTKIVFNYTGPNGTAEPGKCPAGFACNRTSFRCEVSNEVPIESLRGCLTEDVEELQRHLRHLFAFRD